MLFQRPKTINVDSREGLDAALASGSAAQIVVEGDEDLLAYAEQRAAGDPSATVRAERETTVTVSQPNVFINGSEARAFASETVRGPSSSPPEALNARRRRSRGSMPVLGAGTAAVLGLGMVALIGGSLLLRPGATLAPRITTGNATSEEMSHLGSPPEHGSADMSSTTPPVPRPAAPAAPQGPPSEPGKGPEGVAAEGFSASALAPLAWPFVAVVAVIAMFFIIRQALAGGRNVEVSWKVTEKVAGKVIITRGAPARRSARAV